MMKRHQGWLTFMCLASLSIAVGTHDATGRWYAAAVAAFVTSGLAITALVIRRGGTQ